MSLQLVANHLAQKGRGPDSTLVHMSNREVAGLQALAKKHGGQLSVNPDTGLPEAGFLDSILPAVAGGALTAFTGIDPITAGAIVGGITALDSKDLSKGLTAGLGAWGGSSLYGGLAGAGLGAVGPELSANAAANAASQGLTGEAYNQAVQEQVASQLAEKNLAAEGATQLFSKPGQTLATMGGGSMWSGGLPILAGLAPVAADMYDEAPEDDGAPKQKQGYIRKYAFDPVTGQYKQVGVYEAGGDPNKDVTSEAGTAGSYGAVGQSEYEKAQGMAEGGVANSANDSNRIYDYLMGRGPNPMQFTHVDAPQVDYNAYMPKPITPTTPILETPFDQYGNIRGSGGGGGYSPEQREAFNNEVLHDYGDGTMTRNQFWALPEADRKALEDKFAEEHPYKNAFAEGFKTLVMPGGLITKTFDAFTKPFKGIPLLGANPEDEKAIQNLEAQTIRDQLGNVIAYKSLPDQFAGYRPNSPVPGGVPTPKIGLPGGDFSTAPPQGDPAQQRAAQRAVQNAINKTDFSGMDRGSTPNDGRADTSGNDGNRGIGGTSYGSVAPGYGGGSEAATGGLSTSHGFQRMAHGGIADLHQYNLGSYSDGGRLLKGPGDGVSDDIPATIGHGQPARLADGEFVIPARIVSELGNGSTDAGARELYKMMDRIQAGRKKTVGKDQVARNSKAVRHLPA